MKEDRFHTAYLGKEEESVEILIEGTVNQIIIEC